MKKLSNIICLITLLALCIFTGCSSQEKETFSSSVEQFCDNVKSTISKNEGLDGLSLESAELSEDEESATVSVKVSGSDVGFYFLSPSSEDSTSVDMIIASFRDDVKGKDYYKMLNAAWMAFDVELTYEEANEITDELNDIALFGGDTIEKNNITYSAMGMSDNMCIMGASKVSNN